MLEESLGLQGDPTSHPKKKKKITLEYSLEGLMLRLKLQYLKLCHLMRRTDSLEKILILEKIEGRRRRTQQRMNGWMA